MAPPAQTTTAPASEQLPRQGFFLLAPLALFWGTNWLAMKLAVLDMDPWNLPGHLFYRGSRRGPRHYRGGFGLDRPPPPEDLAFHRLRRIRLADTHPHPRDRRSARHRSRSPNTLDPNNVPPQHTVWYRNTLLFLECPPETALKRLDQVFQRRTRAGHDEAFKRHAWIKPDIAQAEERCVVECDAGEVIGLLSALVGERISGHPGYGTLDPWRGPALERGQHDLGPKALMNRVDVLRLNSHFRGESVLAGHHIQDRTSSRDDGARREIMKVHDHAILRG